MPELLIWHSRDLVNWSPIANALNEYVGGVWAPDTIKFKDKFYIYFPAGRTSWVVTATNPANPWSKPFDLKIGGIDPGHVATPEGKRYLNLDGGRMAPLSDDGLSVTAPPKKSTMASHFRKNGLQNVFAWSRRSSPIKMVITI